MDPWPWEKCNSEKAVQIEVRKSGGGKYVAENVRSGGVGGDSLQECMEKMSRSGADVRGGGRGCTSAISNAASATTAATKQSSAMDQQPAIRPNDAGRRAAADWTAGLAGAIHRADFA